MQHDLKHHHLAFLLSLGAMPVAGCTINGDDDDDTNGTTVSTTVSSTDPSAGTEPSTNTNGDTGNDPSADTGNDPSADTGNDPSADTGADTAVDSGTGGEVPAACTSYAQHYVECIPESAPYVDDIAGYCATYFADYETNGAACLAAGEDYYACLAALDCAVFTAEDPACVPESQAVMEACGFTGTSSDGGSSSGG